MGRKVGVAKLTYNNTNYTASLSVSDTYAEGNRVGATASYTQDPGLADVWDTNGANNGTNSTSFPYEPGGVAEVRVWTQDGPYGWTLDYAYGQKTLPWWPTRRMVKWFGGRPARMSAGDRRGRADRRLVQQFRRLVVARLRPRGPAEARVDVAQQLQGEAAPAASYLVDPGTRKGCITCAMKAPAAGVGYSRLQIRYSMRCEVFTTGTTTTPGSRTA